MCIYEESCRHGRLMPIRVPVGNSCFSLIQYWAPPGPPPLEGQIVALSVEVAWSLAPVCLRRSGSTPPLCGHRRCLVDFSLIYCLWNGGRPCRGSVSICTEISWQCCYLEMCWQCCYLVICNELAGAADGGMRQPVICVEDCVSNHGALWVLGLPKKRHK